MSKGYCLAYREAWTHPAFNDLREAAIWNFLYQNAFWEDGERNFNGYTFQLKRGEIVVSTSFLAKGFGMTEKGVRVVIQKLEKLGMLGKRGASRGTIITICNYDKYQLSGRAEGEQEGKRGANKGRAEGENNNKLIKEENNKLNISADKSAHPQKKKLGTRLNENWWLDGEYEAWGEWAMKEFGWNEDKVIDVASRFKDYWIAKSGKDATKANWEATWRNWCRKQQEGF